MARLDATSAKTTNQPKSIRIGMPKARPKRIMYARTCSKTPATTARRARSGTQVPGACTMKARRLCVRQTVCLGLVLLLSACARVTPHLSLPDLRLGEPSFFPTMEAYTAAPIVAGNRVEFLLNGEEIFPALIEAIQSARKTITYAQYFYE